MPKDTLKSELEEAIRAHIAPVVLRGILYAEGRDHDGDPVIRLRIIYDDRNSKLTDDKVFETSGVIQAALDRIGEERFVLTTFVAASETGEAAA